MKKGIICLLAIFSFPFCSALLNAQAPGSLPVVITSQATNLSSTTAQLNAKVLPNDTGTFVWFQYGTTIAMPDTAVPGPSVLNGPNYQTIDVALSGLLPNTFYYYTLNAKNGYGTVSGNLQQLYTTDCEIPNCDFEIWDSTLIDQPVGWHSVGNITRVPSYNGTNAVQITGNIYSGDAEIILGTPSQQGIGVVGGIPFAARPDSLIFYAKYNIVYPDTAAIFLLFKRGGNFIDQFQASITGNSGGNFVRLSYPIIYADTTMPDSLVMAVMNSTAPMDSGNINTVLTVDDISFSGTNILLPDWNFEQWDTLVKLQPASWYSDAYGSVLGGPLVQRVSDCVSGHYAVRMQGARSNAINLLSGPSSRWATGLNGPAFPIAGRHATLDFYLKYLPQPGDSFAINLSFFYHGSGISANPTYFIDTPCYSYTPISIPIGYIPGNTEIPDSAFLNFQIGSNNGWDTSVVYIDNMSFDGFKPIITPTGLIPILPFTSFYIFPNPASSYININTPSAGKKDIALYDMQGTLLMSVNFTGTSYHLDITPLPDAIYLIQVRDAERVETQKVAVVR
jgi:hypothetical protein